MRNDATTASSAARAKLEPAHIPQALRRYEQWVGWHYVESPRGLTKVPVNPRTGKNASTADRRTWGTFEEALAAVAKHHLAGVGFVLMKNDPFTGIDLDQCMDERDEPTPEATALLQRFNSYSEVSPSGRGIRIFIEASKPEWAACRTSQIDGMKQIEIYDSGRFLTITGHRLDAFPAQVECRQAALDLTCHELWMPTEPREHTPVRPPATEDDDELLQRARRARNGRKFEQLYDRGDLSDYDDDHSRADLALCAMLAWWTGNDSGRIDRLFRGSALYREKWERKDYCDRTIQRAITSSSPNVTSCRSRGSRSGARPNILIGPDEHRVVAETVDAVQADPSLYHRGNMLVRVLRDQDEVHGSLRQPGPPRIASVPPPNLRERITACADFSKIDEKGNEKPAHPPDWLIPQVHARGEWPGLRPLMGISDAPVLRPDGSIWQTPGYDEATGVLFESACQFPPVPTAPDQEQAHLACMRLLEIVQDFSFEADYHRAAWLAGLLTPFALRAFRGPAPLFLNDANVRGAGKTLLTQTVGHVVLGRRLPAYTYVHDAEEMRKRITAIAIAGHPIVLLDNVDGRFGNAALDAAMTCHRWADRILGRSEIVELPLRTTWFATGNNVQVVGDTVRRIVPTRLDVLDEHPEQRSDFAHPNLLLWIDRERLRLLVDALTILSAYLLAGGPDQGLKPFGGLEGWSSVVRSSVVWAGLPDPCEGRHRLAATADASEELLRRLIDAWRIYDPRADGLVISVLLKQLYGRDQRPPPGDDASEALRSALEDVVGASPGKPPTARQVGNKLKSFKRRVVNGVMLDSDPNEYHRHGGVWRLYKDTGCPAASLRVCESDPEPLRANAPGIQQA